MSDAAEAAERTRARTAPTFPKEKKSTKPFHPTPMLDQLETGPWPSFISGIKRLRDQHPEQRINEMTNDLLGQLEHSYETRKGYWKGGTVSVFGYGGGIIPRFSEVGKAVPEVQGIPYPARAAAGGQPLHHRHAAPAWPTVGRNTVPGLITFHGQTGNIMFIGADTAEHPALLRRDQRIRLGSGRRRSLRAHRHVLRRRGALRDVLHQ